MKNIFSFFLATFFHCILLIQGRPPGSRGRPPTSRRSRYSYPHRNGRSLYDGEEDEDDDEDYEDEMADSPDPVRTIVTSVSINGPGITKVHIDQLSESNSIDYSPYGYEPYNEEDHADSPQAQNAMELLNGIFDNMV